MTWIETIPMDDADEDLRQALAAAGGLLPEEYETPVHATPDGAAGIVASHSLIPEALRHAFSTFGALMAPDLPLERRQHEMIAAHVSAINRCHY